jgi:hypothetical protein
MRPYHFRRALLSQIRRGNFQQRGANLAVEAGMGSNGNDKTKLEETFAFTFSPFHRRWLVFALR